MRSILLSLTLLAVTASSAGADVISIPMPELAGTYQAIEGVPPEEGLYDQFTTLVLPPEVTAIDQLRLVVSGTWHEGLQWCSSYGEPHSSPFRVGLSMFLSIPEAPSDFFSAGVGPDDGEFVDLTDGFSSCCPPGVLDFNQLLGTTIEVHFFVDWMVLGICWVEEDSWGEVTDVHLEISGTVPVESSTWGAVKSLYR